MDIKTILIIILVAYMVFWYNNPDKGQELLGKGVDVSQSLIDKFKGTTCPTTYDPVCADDKEFDNTCLAQKAGYTDITLGVC